MAIIHGVSIEDPQQLEYLRRDEEYRAKHDVSPGPVSDHARRRLKILVGTCMATGVFLPDCTPDTIIDSLEAQGHWKEIFGPPEEDKNQAIDEGEKTKHGAQLVKQATCTSTCDLIDQILQLSDRMTDEDVHPLFDPLYFFESVNNAEARRCIMPALLMASVVIKKPAAYDFIDGLLFGRREQDRPQTHMHPPVVAPQPQQRCYTAPTRFFLNYSCQKDQYMPENQKHQIDQILEDMAGKLSYKFRKALTWRHPNGDTLLHGQCRPKFEAGTMKVTGCNIEIEAKKLKPLACHDASRSECGTIQALRDCLSLAITLVHEAIHAISFLHDPQRVYRGEPVFKTDEPYEPDGSGEL